MTDCIKYRALGLCPELGAYMPVFRIERHCQFTFCMCLEVLRYVSVFEFDIVNELLMI